MKAMLLMNHGGPEMLHYGETPDPAAGRGDVVVDIHAASVNGADPKVRRGNGPYKLNQFPHIMAATSRVWSARSAWGSPISKSGMPYLA